MGYLLKLLCAIYGLHQALVKFKQEVIDSDCLKATGNGYTAPNDAQTIWIKQSEYHDCDRLPCHAIYTDDFLHYTNNKAMHKEALQI